MCCLPVTHMVLLLYRRLQELIWWEVDFMGSWTMDSGRLMSWEVDFVGFDSTLADRIGTRNVQIVFTNACSTLEAYSPLHAVHWRRIHQCMQYTGGVFTNACSTLEAYAPMHAVHWRHIHQCMQYTGGSEGLGMRLTRRDWLVHCLVHSAVHTPGGHHASVCFLYTWNLRFPRLFPTYSVEEWAKCHTHPTIGSILYIQDCWKTVNTFHVRK